MTNHDTARSRLAKLLLPNTGFEETAPFELLEAAECRVLGDSLGVLEALLVLESYFNSRGEFARSWLGCRFPSPKRVRRRLDRLSQFLDLSTRPSSGSLPRHDFEGYLDSFLRSLDERRQQSPLRTECIRLQGPVDQPPHLQRHLSDISALFERLETEVLAFGYHGSIASRDHIDGLSDCDAIVILRAGVVADPNRAARVRQACHSAQHMMRRIDPFQHHGVFVIPEECLRFYPDDYLPTVVLSRSVFDILAVSELAVDVVGHRLVPYYKALKSSSYLERHCRRVSTMEYHKFHSCLQVAQLLPCFVVACCKEPAIKPDAIRWFSERASYEAQSFLRLTGQIREDWQSICRPRRGITSLWHGRARYDLRDRVIQYFGGANKLVAGLEAVARDARRIVMSAIREPLVASCALEG